MDLNINQLPERDRKQRERQAAETPLMQPAPRDGTATLKVAGFLAVVIVLTALAINGHQGSTEATMASDTPPITDGASTLPSVSAPTDRATTGSAASAPGLAPNAPSEQPTVGTSR